MSIADMSDEGCLWTAFWGTVAASCTGSALGAKYLGPIGAVIGIFLGPLLLWYGVLFGMIGMSVMYDLIDNWKKRQA
mgnify:FL=1